MGLSPAEFYDMTLYEYRCLVCRAYFDRHKKLEQTRYIVHAVYDSQSQKRLKITDVMFPLLTDPQPKKLPAPTAEDKAEIMKRSMDRLKAFANQIKK